MVPDREKAQVKLVKTEETRKYEASPAEVAQAFGISLIDGEDVLLRLSFNGGYQVLAIETHRGEEWD